MTLVILFVCIPAIILGYVKQKEKWERRKKIEKAWRFEHKVNKSSDI